MTSPDQSAAESLDWTLAEKVARARYAAAPVAAEMWPTFDDAPPTVRNAILVDAAQLLVAIQAAGLAVVQLPELQPREGLINGIGIQIEVPSYDGRGWDVTGCYFQGFEGGRVEIGDIGWRDLDRVERDAARLLAAASAVRKLQAEHEARLEHDGAGPPICEPCSAECSACAAERQGGEQ